MSNTENTGRLNGNAINFHGKARLVLKDGTVQDTITLPVGGGTERISYDGKTWVLTGRAEDGQLLYTEA